MMRFPRRLVAISQIALSIFLLYTIYKKLGLSSVKLHIFIHYIPVWSVVIFMATVCVATVVCSYRWMVIRRLVVCPDYQRLIMIRAYAIGNVIGFITPSGLIGEACKPWLIGSRGKCVKNELKAIAADKFVGLFGLILITLVLTSPWNAYIYMVILIPSAVLLLALILYIFAEKLVKSDADGRIISSIRPFATCMNMHFSKFSYSRTYYIAKVAFARKALLLSLINQLVLCTGFFVLLSTVSGLRFSDQLRLSSLLVFASSVPISIGGFGLRELTIAWYPGITTSAVGILIPLVTVSGLIMPLSNMVVAAICWIGDRID